MPELRSIVAAVVPSPWLGEISAADMPVPGCLLLTVKSAMAQGLVQDVYRDGILAAAREAGVDVDRLDFQVSEASQVVTPAVLVAPGSGALPGPEPKQEAAPWVKFPRRVLAEDRLTPAAKLVWAAIKSFSGCPSIYPSVRTIASRCAIADSTVHNGMTQLRRLGYLRVKPGGGAHRDTNEYFLFDHGCRISLLSG